MPAPIDPSNTSTLSGRLELAAGRGRGVTFVGDGRVEWARLHDDARGMAAALQSRGIGPGSHIALLGRSTREFVTAVQAVWLAGATVVVLPLPLRLGSIESFVEQTRRLIRQADASLVLVDPAFASYVDGVDGVPIVMLDSLPAAGSDAFDAPVVDPSSLAILQFTSGSTADPKGVMMPHAG